ncbi:putative ATP-dependent chaperone [Trypanosoma theileri]|uniref:Putative ATP-dependent chaperone n=1 Tax=Trypanosoma theileri TaxID=67003 RepID=A0A1X0NQP6_9TRYP|nr:putative ATP-dependent chaperone [Trypanosoma theileri]ORC86848.1 putative ATP-dependent chaperone [Trypanosoma theileri]
MNFAASGSSSPVAGDVAGADKALSELTALLPERWEERGGAVTRAMSGLLQNPFFSAGAGLYLLTFAGAAARSFSVAVQTALRRRFVVSMELTSQDESFNWMVRWLAQNPAFYVQQVSVTTRNTTIYSNDESSHECLYAPCTNVRHWFWYNNRPMLLQRRRVETQAMGTDVLETMQFTTIGLSARVMQEMVEDAHRLTSLRNSDHTVIYQNSGGRWTRQDPRRRRPMHSVVLDGHTATELLKDVRLFLSSGRYYEDLGVPYRRGYLLHGPPGCGKSSAVMALAGELRLAICPLSLSGRGLSDDALIALLNTAPLRSIVLLEDIDRAFSADSHITMSGLLNALDGVAAQEGRLVFMTTNHVERLDDALIRPGRCDVKVEIGLLSPSQARQLYRKFFPHSTEAQQDQFASQIPARTLSVAQIQSHLFLHRDSAEAAITALPAFLQTVKSFEVRVQRAREKEEAMTRMRRAPMLHNL